MAAFGDCSHCNKLQENDIFHFNSVRYPIPNSHQSGLEFPRICDKLRDACVPQADVVQATSQTYQVAFLPLLMHADDLG